MNEEHGSAGRGNRLVHEPSLYLRQHAHDPVDWYPWGEEALARARQEDKPIFLSIGYASCHWCHVMETEVFSKPDVAALLNEHFIPIKVDREERPDLDAIYMDAVQTLSGQGGWPLSVFLTPDLQPFYGGTYYPQGHFVFLLARLRDLFLQDRKLVEDQALRVREVVAALPEMRPEPVGEETLEHATEQAIREFDPEWGGFRSQMKFPTVPRWRFLLHRYRKTGDTRLARMLRTTLDAIASGGIRDHIGGGFHRYTIEPKWLVPHFEKMLYDNALLASLFLEASVVLDEPRYAEVARDTLDFLLEQMRAEQGGFFASFDADSAEGEGLYYTWRPEEIDELVGPGPDGPFLSRLLGITGQGNFNGRSVPTRRRSPVEVALGTGRSPEEVDGLFDRWRPALRAQRALRPRPPLDRKVITAWNGLAITALAQASAVLGEERYLAAARRAAQFLWNTHRREDGSLLRSSYDSRAANEAVLEDYAFLAEGLVALHQATGDEQQLERALDLIEQVRRHFRHPAAGFSLTRQGGDTPLGSKPELFDSVVPSGTSVMLHVLLQTGELTGSEAYRDEVESTLRAFALLLQDYGLEMAGWLDAAQEQLGPFHSVVIAGRPEDPETAQLFGAFSSMASNHAVIALVPAEGPRPETVALLATTRGKHAQDGRATAYLCTRGSCLSPTHEPEVLQRMLSEGWKY